MQEYEIELSIGDVLQVGDCTVTVIDIDGPEVSFRVDSSEDSQGLVIQQLEQAVRTPR